MQNLVRCLALAAWVVCLIPTRQASAQEVTLPAGADFTAYTWDNELRDGGSTAYVDHQHPDFRLPHNLVQVAAGKQSFAVLTDEGFVWTWGNNEYGTLGDGTTITRSEPRVVPGLGSITRISMNASHVLALRVDGTVWGWGRNDFRQLGDGTTTNRLSPVQVVGLTRVVQVSAGFNHGLAVRDDGTVWAWGHNGLSQLGDGTTTNRPTPVPIAALANITHVSAGGTFSLALRSDGTVWAWGSNAQGQLGDGTTVVRRTPVRTLDLTNIAQISAGYNHAYALTRANGGGAWGWGDNYSGKVIDQGNASYTTPQFLGSGFAQVDAGPENGHTLGFGRAHLKGYAFVEGLLTNRVLEREVPAVAWWFKLLQVATGGQPGNSVSNHIGLAIRTFLFPDLRGKTVAQANAVLQPLDMAVDYPYSVVDANCENLELIVRQRHPESGGRAGVGDAVSVEVARWCPMPNLIGQPFVDLNLQSWHLTLGSVRFAIDHSCANIGNVIRQSPNPGENVGPGTPVRITVGDTPPHPCP